MRLDRLWPIAYGAGVSGWVGLGLRTCRAGWWKRFRMSDPDEPPSLKELGDRIDKVRQSAGLSSEETAAEGAAASARTSKRLK